MDCSGLSCLLPSGWALPEGNEKWVVEGGMEVRVLIPSAPTCQGL